MGNSDLQYAAISKACQELRRPERWSVVSLGTDSSLSEADRKSQEVNRATFGTLGFEEITFNILPGDFGDIPEEGLGTIDITWPIQPVRGRDRETVQLEPEPTELRNDDQVPF